MDRSDPCLMAAALQVAAALAIQQMEAGLAAERERSSALLAGRDKVGRRA